MIDGAINLLLSSKKIIFWDFDGVIKDSVEVKTNAFKELFSFCDEKTVCQIAEHHQANGGVSRYIKIPLYLESAGLAVTKANVELFCSQFSSLVLREVINSPWVPGVLGFLLKNYRTKSFFLVTATPQDEIDYILKKLEINHFFKLVNGAPIKKEDAIARIIKMVKIDPKDALMIGDSDSDYFAANANQIGFLLRRTLLNKSLQSRFVGPQFESFT